LIGFSRRGESKARPLADPDPRSQRSPITYHSSVPVVAALPGSFLMLPDEPSTALPILKKSQNQAVIQIDISRRLIKGYWWKCNLGRSQDSTPAFKRKHASCLPRVQAALTITCCGPTRNKRSAVESSPPLSSTSRLRVPIFTSPQLRQRIAGSAKTAQRWDRAWRRPHHKL